MTGDVALPAFDVLSLCSGYGGLDLALRLASGGRARTVCYAEIEAAAAAVLAARMADGALDAAPVWDDLSTFDGRPWRGVVDLVAGGIPCQPFSVAGKRAGTDDPRWLWPHMRRVAAECGAPFLLLENVPGFAARGLRAVVDDLAADGFAAEWDLFSAAQVGLPHRRERLFLLAHRDGEGRRELAQRDRGPLGRGRLQDRHDPDGRDRPLADAGRRDLDAGQPLALAGGGDPTEPRPAGPGVADPDGGGRGPQLGRDGAGQPDAAGHGRRDGAEPLGGGGLADAGGRLLPVAAPRPEGRDGARPAGGDVVDADRLGGGEGADVARARVALPHRPGAEVADADRDGRAPDGGGADGDGREGADAPWPGFPDVPGRGDRGGWDDLVAARPDLAPATFPEFRGDVDGASAQLVRRIVDRTRRPRLHMLGNGVVPATGALAVRVLWGRLMEGTP